MPEILLRMKIASKYTLKELQSVFNQILNKVVAGQGPSTADAAALYYFPEVFQSPRDEYVASLINTIVEDNAAVKQGDERRGYSRMTCYLGNVHVKPVSRLILSNQATPPAAIEDKAIKRMKKSLKRRGKKVENF